ncbi:hypothetical protein PIROE2DRAFT_15899 [Piromyces sp. E2]|nr:hypothetical protein PIROE2DRAFT_15899 [Piromyces sp. E2]|eukprot:OUM58746.1 hypothetical protein PIROE2DRAFT_15899 [Piromyces sp. E2]
MNIELKDLINSLNEELEKNKINIIDDTGNYILNEKKVKEQFNKDLVESFCDKLSNNSKYKSEVIEEIIKNNRTIKDIVNRKAINDLIDSIKFNLTNIVNNGSKGNKNKLVNCMKDLTTDNNGVVRDFNNNEIYYYPFSTNTPNINDSFLEYAFSMSIKENKKNKIK